MLTMIEFSKLVDNGIVMVVAPTIYNEPIDGVVRGTEGAGIWIESDTLTELMHKALQRRVLEGKPLFFIPFTAIVWASVFLDEPSISETLLNDSPSES
jgi:hypothetical protein